MSKLENVESSPIKGQVMSFLGTMLFVPLGLLPKVMFQLYLLPGIFLNLLQENLPLEVRYLPGLFVAFLSFYFFDSIFVTVLVLSTVIVLGLFNNFYRSTNNLFKSGLYSILPFSLLIISLIQFGFSKFDVKSSLLNSAVTWELLQLKLPAHVQIDELLQLSYLKELILFYPATIIIFFSLVVFSALIFERKLTSKLFKKTIKRLNLNQFKVPDYFIWVALVSGAIAFVDHQFVYAKYIAQNVIFICCLLYYFQGFAVLFNFFEVFKVGPLTKVLMIFCLAISLVHVTVVMGLLDYWYNFRARFLKKATQVNERRKL